jgi:hypothetical protein
MGEAKRKATSREDAMRALARIENNLLRPLPSIFNSRHNRSVALSHFLSAALQIKEPPLAYDATATAADAAAVEEITRILADTALDTPEITRMRKQVQDAVIKEK